MRDGLTREIDAVEAALTGLVDRIARQLAVPAPRDRAAIAAAEREVTRHVRAFPPLFQRITAAQAQETARVRATAPGPAIDPAWVTLGRRAHMLRQVLNRWPLVREIVVTQAAPPRKRLFRRAERDPHFAEQATRTDALLNRLHAVLNPAGQDPEADDHGCFADIPLANSRFMEAAHAARRVLRVLGKSGTRFLDIGCGGGLKVLSAAGYFDACHGLEYDPGYVAAARRLLRRAERTGKDAAELRILKGDALRFARYGSYDVLYFYRPIKVDAEMHRLERRILDAVPAGTLLIAPYGGFARRNGPPNCACIDGSLHVAGMSARRAAGLRRAAERIGPATTRARDPLPGLWEPILAASIDNGFALSYPEDRLTA